MSAHILHAYHFNGQNTGKDARQDLETRLKSEQGLTWVHLDVQHGDTKEWLKTETEQIDPFVMQALLNSETRPRLTEIGHGIVIILRSVPLNEEARSEDMVSLRLWVDEKRIISLQRRPSKAVAELEKKIKNGKIIKDSGQFLCALIDVIITYLEPNITTLNVMTDKIEEHIITKPHLQQQQKISDIRRKSIVFRRHLAPQRDVVAALRNSSVRWLHAPQKRHLLELHDRLMHCIEELDTMRERSQIVKDELVSQLSYGLNKNMYIFSLMAAIFLPLSFLTGLLGINVGGIPGAESGEAFWIFLGLLAAIVAAQIILFKKLKWF